jgi:hypothetical protein
MAPFRVTSQPALVIVPKQPHDTPKAVNNLRGPEDERALAAQKLLP